MAAKLHMHTGTHTQSHFDTVLSLNTTPEAGGILNLRFSSANQLSLVAKPRGLSSPCRCCRQCFLLPSKIHCVHTLNCPDILAVFDVHFYSHSTPILRARHASSMPLGQIRAVRCAIVLGYNGALT